MTLAMSILAACTFTGFICYGAGRIVGRAAGYRDGRDSADKQCERLAVKVGHAEYFLDADNNRQCRWKELPQ